VCDGRLASGVYKKARLVPEEAFTEGINLFPDKGDLVSVGCAKGLEV